MPDFDEDKHPREHGKFASAGGESGEAEHPLKTWANSVGGGAYDPSKEREIDGKWESSSGKSSKAVSWKLGSGKTATVTVHAEKRLTPADKANFKSSELHERTHLEAHVEGVKMGESEHSPEDVPAKAKAAGLSGAVGKVAFGPEVHSQIKDAMKMAEKEATTDHIAAYKAHQDAKNAYNASRSAEEDKDYSTHSKAMRGAMTGHGRTY